MYHFFVEPNRIAEKTITITGQDVNHIKNVIRLKQGDEISVSNGIDGRDYRCIINSIGDFVRAYLYKGRRRRASVKSVSVPRHSQRR